MKQIPKVGTYTGSGAAINLSLGFTPEYIRVVNTTDGDESWEWFANMPNGSALAQAAAGTQSRINANGIGAYAGSPTASKGFTIGTALSEAGKTFAYFAIRGDD